MSSLPRSFLPVCISLSLLMFVPGCATSNLFSGGLFGGSKSSAVDADASNGDRDELPPKEAAKACLAAAEALETTGHPEQAIGLYEKARGKDPAVKSVAHHLAVLYDAQGDSARALAEFNKAAAEDPKNPAVLSDFGYYYYERGNQAQAERMLREALALDPNHAKALDNLGFVLAAQGRFDESCASFAKVVGPAAAHSNLGVLLAKQGKYDRAKREFHQALAIDPSLRPARAFLDYLERRPENDLGRQMPVSFTSPNGNQ